MAAAAALGLERGGCWWPLKRYGRLESATAGPAPGVWKTFESCQEKGLLSLTLVESGHFLIAQGPTLLEGFSLIEAPNWLRAERKGDCVLFGSKIKNASRMFRVQFNGDSKEQAQEHCSGCIQKLLQYINVENPNGKIQDQTPLTLSQATNSKQSETSGLEEGEVRTCSAEEEQPITQNRLCIRQLAQSMLGEASLELPLVYQQSALNTEELGPFLRLSLMDQHFPAFVEQVECELRKVINE
ncbi:meiotic recombination protein REC114 [Callorhinchus milii]|uniref:meiotic recombination protein REC114 n=1 Tax=Callorhinchus milii TaxID=7868 RepID=UPI001C3F8BC8|nr:meiotic recombination protein REC114 [Callorhinchus milii]